MRGRAPDCAIDVASSRHHHDITEMVNMDVIGAQAELEEALSRQMALAGDDPAVAAAADSLLAALGPAVRQLVTNIAEQAAAEVGAQLPGHTVNVVLSDGEPSVSVRPDESTGARFTPEDLEARLTVRLPEQLKAVLEDAAAEAGDSVNSYVIRTLSTSTAGERTRVGRRLKGTLHT
jgi:hypothetical protein